MLKYRLWSGTVFWANCAKYSKNWLPYALHHNPLLIIDPSWILTRAEFSEKNSLKAKNGLPKYTSHGLQWLVYGIYSNSIKFVAVFPIFNSKSYIEVELNIGSFFSLSRLSLLLFIYYLLAILCCTTLQAGGQSTCTCRAVRTEGGTVCSNGFYADIWSQRQVQQYKSFLKSIL